MTQLLERAFEKAQILPPSEQDLIARKVLDEVESRLKDASAARKPRTPGLGKGMVEIADDFCEPLPDSFWLGEE
jgi:hypothetical protein